LAEKAEQNRRIDGGSHGSLWWWQLHGTAQLIHDFIHGQPSPRVFPSFSKLFPSLGRNGFGGFEEWGGFIELKNVAWFEVQPVANMDRDGDLAFGSKGRLHDNKVSGKSKEKKFDS
jgi:hypothetical protein